MRTKARSQFNFLIARDRLVGGLFHSAAHPLHTLKSIMSFPWLYDGEDTIDKHGLSPPAHHCEVHLGLAGDSYQSTFSAASIGVKVETATGLKREDSPPGVPSGLIAAAFRTAKDGAGQTPGSGGTWWLAIRH
jgi:hypothetical protein